MGLLNDFKEIRGGTYNLSFKQKDIPNIMTMIFWFIKYLITDCDKSNENPLNLLSNNLNSAKISRESKG